MQPGLLHLNYILITHQSTYNKAERLKSRKLIEHLFSKGRSYSVFPLKVLYDFVPLSHPLPLQGGVTVSSRNFKKAVHRNRIKRVLREAYRLNKSSLQQILLDKHLQLAVFFIYTGKELPAFEEIDFKMSTLIKKLIEIVAKDKGM